MHDKVTIGELYRRLDEMGERIEKKLDGIDTQVRITNGRTTKLEVLVDGLRRDVDAKGAPVTPANLQTIADGESLSVKVSPKMWALIVSLAGAGGMFLPLVAEWLKSLVTQ